jgi:hypothetical protein
MGIPLWNRGDSRDSAQVAEQVSEDGPQVDPEDAWQRPVLTTVSHVSLTLSFADKASKDFLSVDAIWQLSVINHLCEARG